MTVRYLVGDTREMVATLDAGSVSLVATSPPFIALRSYLPADHPMKHAEIGSEPDPATFLDTLLALTAEWGRVLAPWGSIAVELGDTYAGSGGAGGDYNDGGLRDGQQAFTGSSRKAGEWPRPKCLALVPQLYAASLAYGRNLLTGEESPAGQWLVRNMVVWHRPNPAVGALGDKYRPSTSYITIATRSPKRWFDLTAVRGEFKAPDNNTANLARGGPTYGIKGPNLDRADLGAGNFYSNPAGAPPLDAWFDEHDTWTLTTQPSSLAHYAMWPPKLAERLILSMCPAEVCAFCGEPRRRTEKATDEYRNLLDSNNGGMGRRMEITDSLVNQMGGTFPKGGDRRHAETIGWTDCGCGVPFTPGIVLDPFGGTGTTGAVAHLHGRDAVLIDIDERNRDMYPARLDECRKALFGTTPELPGQLDMFAEGVA